MAIVHARLETPQAQRLLTRLGRHWGHKFEVEMEAGRLLVPFSDEVRTWLQASDAVLDVRIEHPTQAGADELKGVVADHLQRFSKDEELVFGWS
ncbi:DUF2218 domain-containing protein [Alcanivorax sp. JB21]|uniref:DUF2218 domain-containing protein n=1 Tax=Alcanivorax limicola TaxID=2874102 RepID=UPI001CBE2ED4|nr:DUF2218 domain-containing protein [Alcanivorax limicola]MBZ2189038.1 DUF2218 domain-containing protein [Alcanivorax limicola]